MKVRSRRWTLELRRETEETLICDSKIALMDFRSNVVVDSHHPPKSVQDTMAKL